MLLALACAGCSGSYYESHWDGRRGYDGHGDYGYDVAASQAEARSYRSQAARSYPVPGTPDDPWGPYVLEAAARFQVPDRWVRAVMQQESGGQLYGADGSLTTSSAGAMGLMQVMPETYDGLRQRYGLGSDPYNPHDNILAGTAYIREMYDRFGAPGFLAAYNAGPDRLDAYLSDGTPLPEETISYLASVAPQLGAGVAMVGPLAAFANAGAATGIGQQGSSSADLAYAGGGMTGAQYNAARGNDGAYAGGGMTGPAYYAGAQTASGGDDSDKAFDGGGLVTPASPTGQLTGQPTPVSATASADWGPPADRSLIANNAETSARYQVPSPQPMPSVLPAVAQQGVDGVSQRNWGIQVGAYAYPADSQAAIAAARTDAGDLLAGAQPVIAPVWRAGVLYRARLVGLSVDAAQAACARLVAYGIACFPVAPGT